MIRYSFFIASFISFLSAPDAKESNTKEPALSEGVAYTEDDNFLFEGDETLTLIPEPDPFEPVNRAIFQMNRVLDGLLLEPAAIVFREALPTPVQKGTNNFVKNLFAPLSFVNYLLQGNIEHAFKTLGGFVLNSTLGVFGVLDISKEVGLAVPQTFLNETFAKWGMKTGPYLMLPFLGPSSFRGLYGAIGDIYLNPLYHVVGNTKRSGNHYHQQKNLLYAVYGLDLINRRAQLLEVLNEVEQFSFDPYVDIRTMYFQRQNEIMRRMKP